MSNQKKSHIHEWIKNGHKHGKQRYICKICGQTCYEMDMNLRQNLYSLALNLIHSYPNNEEFIWNDVVEFDENQDEIDIPIESYRFKIEKIRKSRSEFFSMLKNGGRLYKPMIVWMCEADPENFDWRNNKLLIYEVT